ncbi:hypothetical protein BH09ACT1_BH09ACT1_23830 [soil metagenome]
MAVLTTQTITVNRESSDRLDRLATRVALYLLCWTQVRARRNERTYEERVRVRVQLMELERRQHEARLLGQRWS